MTLDPRIAAITERIVERSRPTRARYLDRMARAAAEPACAARSWAAPTSPTASRPAGRGTRPSCAAATRPTSASSPPTTTCSRPTSPTSASPTSSSDAAREAGGDGAGRGRRAGHVRRRHPGRGGHGAVAVLARRDRAGDRRGALAPDVRRRALSRRLRQDRAGPRHRRAGLRPPARDLRAGRADDVRPAQRREGAASASSTPRARWAATRCSRRSRSPITGPAPAPSTARPTPTRC